MPTEFASAIADLRLSGDKLGIDSVAVQRQLLRITQQLEQQAQINLRVGVDVAQAQRDLAREVTRLTQRGAFNVPVGLDADKALDELVALQGVVDPLAVPVTALVDRALEDIASLQNAVDFDPVVVPFDIDTSGARAAMDNVVQSTLPPTVDAFARAGEQSGLRFTDRLTSITSRAVGTLGLALGGFVGTALVTGFARLTTIEDATASLTVALQDATKAAQVLDDVLGVVTGTPFNLDQFATAASNLISFGVEAEKIPQYLTAIGEAAANRGSRANEFAQRLAGTFGQIQIQGRILGDDLLQLQAAGVDALRILGNQFEVTTEEAQELIREGVIPVDQALDALSDGILNGTDGVNGATVAFAGTMANLRNTLTGTIGGFKSATARLGVAIIDPIQDVLITGFGAATDIVNQFNKAITESLSGVSESEGFQNFLDTIGELPDKVDPLIETLSGLGPALAPLAAAFGAAGLGQLAGLIGPLSGLATVLNPLVLGITAFIATTPEIREELIPVITDLAESAAILGFGLATALGDGLEELTPLIADFIDAIGDFTPLIRTFATLGAGLARGFVPVLGALADILDGFPVEVLTAIGAGFLAFKAIDALRSPLAGVVQRLDSVSAGLLQAEQDAARFGNRWTETAGRVGISSSTVAKANDALVRGLNAASVAAVGFFSGIAIASDDATVQITGFVGAATSIAAAFKSGPVAGLTATAATIGGALVAMWTNSKQAAEEYRDLIGEVAQDVIDDLGEATAALLDAQDLLGRTELRGQAIELIGKDQVAELRGFGITLDDIIEAAKNPEFRSVAADAIAEAEIAAAAAAEAAANRGEDYGMAYGEAFSLGLLESLKDVEGIDLANLITIDEVSPGLFVPDLTGVDDLIDKVGQLGDIAKETDKALDEGLKVAISEMEVAFREANRGLLTDDSLSKYTKGIEGRVEQLGLKYTDVIKQIEDSADIIPILIDQSFRFLETGINPLDPIILGLEGVEEKYGLTIKILEDGGLQIIESNKDVGDSYKGIEDDAEEMADAVQIALDRADRASQRLNDSLKDMLDTLTEITEQQDFAAGFRDIGAALDEIVNMDALRDAERLIDDIANQRDDIATLERKIAEEQGEANILAADLDRRIAEAAAIGATNGLAVLQAQRDNVFTDLRGLQGELGAKQAELAQFQAELATIDQVPQTLGDLLEQQAAQHGLSLFEFLITAPTDEARGFFQSQLAPQIEQAATLIQREIDESPLLASIEIPNILELLTTGLVAQGLDPALVNDLVFEVFDPALLADEAVKAFETEFNAAVAQLGGLTEQLLDPEGKPIDQSIDINAIVTDVGEGIEDLKTLQAQGVAIPGDIDLSAAEETLAQFQDVYEESDFALIIPIEGDISGIVADLEALQEFALSLQVAQANALLPGVGGSSIRFLADGGIVEFFKNGGITENHIAQLARHGTIRVWAEPETGGEAYIPLAPSKRPRSEQILGQVAAEFGLALTRAPVGGGLSTADIEEAVYRGSAKGVGSLQQAGQDYEGSVIMHNYFPDGTIRSQETARDIRRRFVKTRRRGRR